MIETNWEKTNKKNTFAIFYDVYSLLNRKEKTLFFIVFLVRCGNIFAELLSISAILPYMYVLADPYKAQSFPILGQLYNISGGGNAFVLWSTISFALLYALKCVYVELSYVITTALMSKIKTKHSSDLYTYYMQLPYEEFIAYNPNILQRRVTILVGQIIAEILTNSMRLIVQLLTGIGLILIMFVATSSIVVIAAILLIFFFIIIFYCVREKGRQVSIKMNHIERALHNNVLENFRAFKELRVYNREEMSSKEITGLIKEVNHIGIKRRLLETIPGQVLEWGALCVLLTLLVGSYFFNGSLENGIAEFSLCAACIVKLRAVLIQAISFSTIIHVNSNYYDELIDNLKAASQTDVKRTECEVLQFEKEIDIKDISFRYFGAKDYAISNFSTVIEKGKCYGISGKSGAGKSTLVDILMGLLTPQKGEIYIDGRTLYGNERAWRQNVGYVTQDIILRDASIVENVAFGIPVEKIDMEKFWNAISVAQLYDFVMEQSEKELAQVGEDGVLLSGGQKQRIGIARALYSGAKVLIFDEAYNSLDAETEREILSYLKEKKGINTIIIISHNENTLNICDSILHIK